MSNGVWGASVSEKGGLNALRKEEEVKKD